MIVALTQDKKEKFVRAAQAVLAKAEMSIREVAGLVGLMVAYSPALEYGGAHLKWLMIDKNKALKRQKGIFDARMWVSERSKDIQWWLDHLEEARLVGLDTPSVEIRTDASMEGWGPHRGDLEFPSGQTLQTPVPRLSWPGGCDEYHPRPVCHCLLDDSAHQPEWWQGIAEKVVMY